MTDLEQNADVYREVRASFFANKSALPASTLLQITRLANPSFLIEVDATARRRSHPLPRPLPAFLPIRRAISADLDVRQRVDETAAQLAAGQEQVTRDINKLQEVEQDILAKISAPPPRPAAAPVRRSVPLPPLPPTPPEAQPAH
jgi:hypothetical protein